MDKGCEQCGVSLRLMRAGARFCSTRCRVASHRCKQAFPEAMTSSTRWVRADGKRPITTTGRAASSTNPATWSSHREVLESTAGDGMGIMLGGGLGCWDLDHCLVGGSLTPAGRELLDSITAPIVFTEVSVSGAGLHVFTIEPESKASQGPWGGHYSSGRFIRTTGIRFTG